MKVSKMSSNYLGSKAKSAPLFITAIALILFSSIILGSCSNFLGGSLLKDDIQSAIDYAKATSYAIKISSSYGKISPNGVDKYKVGDYVSINFNSDSDYQFIRWVAYNGNEELSDEYIKFDNVDESETKFTFEKSLGENVELNIMPECILRPQIVSATPLYNSDGVYRDRRIIIMFDNMMDESSIYYSDLEQQKLIEMGYVLLIDSEREKCYGYWDGINNSSYEFKNITITKRNNASENLLSNYKPPYFDGNDKSVLRIDPQKEDLETNPPPGATDILVTVNNQMGCKINGKLITLPGNYRWTYYTSGKLDIDEPQFMETGDSIFKVQFATTSQQDYTAPEDSNENKTPHQIAADNILGFTAKNKTLYAKNYLDTKRLWVSGMFFDGGSGPNYLKWEVWKVDSPYYPVAKEEKVDNGQISDLVITGSNAVIQKYLGKDSYGKDIYSNGVAVDIKNNLSEGLYRIDFIIADINEKINKKSYYFVYDKTGTTKKININNVTNSRPTASYETVTIPDSCGSAIEDYDYISRIECWNGNTKVGEATFDSKSNSYSKKFEGLKPKVKYTYKFYTKDIIGNESQVVTEWNDNTPPSNVLNFYSGGSDKAVTLFWDNPNDEDFYFTEISTGTSHLNPVEIITDKNTHNYRKQTQSYNNTMYGYSFRTCDYSGNYSEYMPVTTGKSGVRVGDICYERDLGNGKYEISCSNKVYKDIPGLKPVGVVLDIQGKTGTITSSGKTTTDSTIYEQTRIMSVKNIDSTSYIWGKCGNDTNGMKSHTHSFDGLLNYNYYKANYKAQTFDYTGGYVASTGDPNIKTVWYYIENDKRVQEPYLEWYLPAVDELKICAGNSYNTAFATINTLKSNGFDVDGKIGSSTSWITSTSSYDNNDHFFRASANFANVHDNGDFEYRDRRIWDRIVCLAQYDFSSSYTPVK